jgi:hypothetical protein
MGAPAKPTVVSKATVVFVWPCYAASDSFLEEDSREVEFERDRKARAQYLRLREGLSTGGRALLEASGALHVRFVSPRRGTEVVHTTAVDWRGVLVFCPDHKVRRISNPEAVVPDAVILDAAGACSGSQGQSPTVQPKVMVP